MFYVEAAALVADKTAKYAIEHASEHGKKLKALMSSGWRRIVDGKTVVVLTGMGGVGKTTLQQVISGEKIPGELDPDYAVSLGHEKTTLRDQFFVSVYTQPGQAKHAKCKIDELRDGLKGAQKLIYVPVVSYGRNALSEITLDALQKRFGGDDVKSVADRYFDNQLEEEVSKVDAFSDLLDDLADGVEVEILTVVTKMDLWWSMNAQVRDHYEHGPYQVAIQRLIDRHGNLRIRHNVVSVCLIQSNITTEGGDVLAATAEGFDVRILRAQYVNFTDVVRQVLGV